MIERDHHRIDQLRQRVARGEIVVLDGGTGTELQALGVPMDGEAWSAVANLTHLDAVQRLHASFLAAGADVLITNTFAAGPGPLAAAGYAARVDEANVNAVSAAAAAREQVGRDEVVIVGSMSRMVANGLSRSESVDAGSADEDRLRDAFGRQARILANAGVDALALEMIGARARPCRPSQPQPKRDSPCGSASRWSRRLAAGQPPSMARTSPV